MSSRVALPSVPDRRLAVRLTPDALRQVRSGHPWVFEGSVRSGGDDGVAGQLAVVFDEHRRFVAVGLWDPTSPIRLRVLQVGTPRPIDATLWRERVEAALDRRAALLADPTTTGLRLVHGENDGLPGVVADLYDRSVVVKLYSPAWFSHLDAVVDAVGDGLSRRGTDLERVVVRFSRAVRGGETYGVRDGGVHRGAPVDGPVTFLERGLAFEADLVSGQKTGHFLDQRDNRVRVGRWSRDRTVLDVFACTGGFSVHAAAGGATEVTSVDLSRRSLDTAAANWAANRHLPSVASAHHRSIVGDAFDVMDDLRRRGRWFDLVVVDPPSFAHRARDRDAALAAYARLAALGTSLVGRGGRYVQSSCSSHVDAVSLRAAVLEGAARSGRQLRVDAETAHPEDHPIGFAHGAYLSTVFARLDRS